MVKAAFQSDSSNEGKPGGLGAGRASAVVWRGKRGRAGRKDDCVGVTSGPGGGYSAGSGCVSLLNLWKLSYFPVLWSGKPS